MKAIASRPWSQNRNRRAPIQRFLIVGLASLLWVAGPVSLSGSTGRDAAKGGSKASRPTVGTSSSEVDLAKCEIDETYEGKFSKCIVDQNNDVIIGGQSANPPCRGTVFLDSFDDLPALGKITINKGGALKLFDRTTQLPREYKLSTKGIDVAGSLELGDAKCPIGTISKGAKVIITFTGDKDPNCKDASCPGYTKGIQLEAGGTLKMYGAKGVPNGTNGVSWTYLGDAAGPSKYDSTHKVKVPAKSDTQIVVKDDVTAGPGAWQPNDWIAVAGTGFSPFETEFVQIAALGGKDKNGNTIIDLSPATPLKFYHFGSLPPTGGMSDGADRNYGVDERAEVALISRNIKLTADTPATGTSNHWGGELKFLNGFKELALQGVEIEKFGKDKIASYPIHFHKDGDLSKTPVLVNANSIHHSYDKCITVHSTSNLTISNNVCARIVGHIFYEEIGDEDNIAFDHNLGLGAMSNWFDVNDGGTTETARNTLISKYWWVGDNMVAPLNNDPKKVPFDAFKIPDHGNQNAPTVGSCMEFGSKDSLDNGSFVPAMKTVPPCNSGDYYYEPASGFWIVNPSAKLTGNSIGGCQGEGKGYWYVPPTRNDPDLSPSENAELQKKKFIPIGTYKGVGDLHGTFVNNRAHGCDSGLYSGDNQDINAEALQPYQGGSKLKPDGIEPNHATMAEFTGVTVTRNRFRGIWLRPSFWTVQGARVAGNRDGVSLVTSGGPDGNYPGIYSMLKDSVIVGISQNNVDRFGPCPALRQVNGFGQIGGWTFGCLDKTAAAKGKQGTGADRTNVGYPDNRWNWAGYMIYDGPALMFHNRFVNFKVDPSSLMTTDDVAYLNKPPPPIPPPLSGVYEGDAAFGWFQGNISSYPVITEVEKAIFDNTDFRHQVYTELVNISPFHDGDKNTTIIDLDGTLGGYQVRPLTDMSLMGKLHPISLNNLGLNASGTTPGGSVDECQATGKQDAKLEGRASANFSPGEVGALEFQTLFPNPPAADATADDKRHDQMLTFTKDSTEFHPPIGTLHTKMVLGGRDGQGVWEPKVQSGYGYTVEASSGIASVVHVAVVDTEKPNTTSTTPFYVRVGICYTGTGTNTVNNHPNASSLFAVTQGYRSWGGGGVAPNDQNLRSYYNQLDGASNGLTGTEACFNLDHQNYQKDKNCPSVGVTPLTGFTCAGNNGFPGGNDETKDTMRELCLYPKNSLMPADSIDELKDQNGNPVLNKYYYDPTTGWLFLNVAQTNHNAIGPSPLGACTGDTASDPYFCPSQNTKESYYVCPPEGCWDYGITLNDSSWQPMPSACGDAYFEYGTPPTPTQDGELVAVGSSTAVDRTEDGGQGGKFPHYKPASEPSGCITPK
jgi:hypothetical protein